MVINPYYGKSYKEDPLFEYNENDNAGIYIPRNFMKIMKKYINTANSWNVDQGEFLKEGTLKNKDWEKKLLKKGG